ncbi:UbiH/UbiF/VisC/COQ6 family ubiquinone biosynthesis hydroxylase [Thiohalophilus thiocyanatoxydans]|uniref:2-octaprenyl-6-methoxyphenol hydroxylase /2-octaprenyl-3-methyl-6-methoxy-1,4-benzoquinol hydroxylase n=1 Tax=Thiohalophilus thiocyanatoxydans TaxID=381308 RepID=A0A4R8ITB9_9GAMM|nr:UbiH/UbiF/VisC/COQ6 family ubiquinone biosynthesis hydroxylase [Thiohalophilus thiocyanatoxydans]TDY04292.1 2-octaprenyl-6-methoxyphenol hydroxylase /2-octaprenyl-3-methyl-6-methoxy-1,4-benzoquinol hydroxylase [Thiohalophilus thiocyanatoxydans]
MSRDYDLIIVGGSMVGASLACALADTPLRIALLDAKRFEADWPADGFDLRVSAITRASEAFLQQLDAWPGDHAERVSPFREMHVWDATGDGVIHFDSAELGEATLGHIVENRVLIKTLHRQIDAAKNIDYLAPVAPTAIEFDDKQARLLLEDGEPLTAKLLVGADGGNSWVRRQAGISVRGWDYDQAALVTWVKTEQFHQETAWQRFLPDGPLAFLPLSEGYSSIVWSTSPQHARQLQQLDEAPFRQELAASFGHTLGEIEDSGPRAVFPLRFFETEHYIRPRLTLVGDAAHTIHPLAGQGVNLGFADAQSLAQVIREAQQRQQDIGSQPVLRRYERWRRADNRAMLIAMDSFKRLFGSQWGPLRWLRNTGLNLTDRLGPLKQIIMRQAMGSPPDRD